MLPACILFGFYINEHMNYDNGKSVKGLGLRGIWIGFSIGTTFLILG